MNATSDASIHGTTEGLLNILASKSNLMSTSLYEANIQTFIAIRNAYDECDPEVREIVDDMLAIYSDGNSSEDEKRRAMNTVIEAIFPSLAADVCRMEKSHRQTPEGAAFEREMDEEEAAFAEKVRHHMKAQGITQELLAEKVGVGQPAISNMLNRQCRPQNRTIAQLAEALGVSPRELWPRFEETVS